jgi:lincosamide nucleotidyltransferase A/C/D/E
VLARPHAHPDSVSTVPMDEEDTRAVLTAVSAAGVDWWLDGGWGVDALLGRQTREHQDVDIVLSREAVPKAEQALTELGFRHDVSAEPGLPARFVMVDGEGGQVDFHLVVFDSWGNAWQQLSGAAWGQYPAEGLSGTGRVGDLPVRCVSPELQLRHHLGYDWSDNDARDMTLLARAFRLPLPPAH